MYATLFWCVCTTKFFPDFILLGNRFRNSTCRLLPLTKFSRQLRVTLLCVSTGNDVNEQNNKYMTTNSVVVRHLYLRKREKHVLFLP